MFLYCNSYLMLLFSNFSTHLAQVESVEGSVTVEIPNSSAGEPPKAFTFDIVFGRDSKQLDVYNEAARPIVENVLEGYNGMSYLLYC